MLSDDTEVEALVKAYREVSPYLSDRQLVLQQLLTSAGYCEAEGSSAWSVTLSGSGYRLNVGQVEVLTNRLTCMDSKTSDLPVDRWFSDFRILISGPESPELVSTLAEDCRIEPMNYKSVGGPHWCVHITVPLRVPPSDPEREKARSDMAAVQSAHRHYVANAAHTSTGKLRQKSSFARSHCAALITCARRETSRRVGSPSYPDQVWNDELTVEAIPAVDAPWHDISMFALTTKAYDPACTNGDLELTESVERKHELSLSELRTALFNRQRLWRWNVGHGESEEGPAPAEMDKIRQLLDEVRNRVADRSSV